jgi:hypothetical protein
MAYLKFYGMWLALTVVLTATIPWLMGRFR